MMRVSLLLLALALTMPIYAGLADVAQVEARKVPVVVVEAHDKVHGLGGRSVAVDLRTAKGPGYTVKRR
jgi:hypothetical protein